MGIGGTWFVMNMARSSGSGGNYTPPPRCPHCKAELVDWKSPSKERWYDKEWFMATTAFLFLASIFWLTVTFCMWLLPDNPGQTLVKTIVEQWDFIISAVHRIW
jgi:hypothetical protein